MLHAAGDETPRERGVKHGRQLDVIDVLPVTGEQTSILPAAD
jgi:hypothetical protein